MDDDSLACWTSLSKCDLVKKVEMLAWFSLITMDDTMCNEVSIIPLNHTKVWYGVD
jgi:hypothetical protein